MKKILALLVLSSATVLAQEVKIEEVIAPKGYILSNDLKEKQCSNIWTKQIKLFMENNQKIKNPDIIQIGEKIQVQNCSLSNEIVEKEDTQETILHPEQSPEVVTEQSSKFSFFILGSYLNQQVAKKGDDGRKSSEGYKVEIGKYFNLGENQLKLSLGLSKLNSIYKDQFLGSEHKRANGFLHLESSYLFHLENPKHQIGPNLGLVYNPYSNNAEMKDFKNRDRDSKISPNLGLNYVYSFTESWKLDFKLSNRIESRVNTWSSLGVEYNF